MFHQPIGFCKKIEYVYTTERDPGVLFNVGMYVLFVDTDSDVLVPDTNVEYQHKNPYIFIIQNSSILRQICTWWIIF